MSERLTDADIAEIARLNEAEKRTHIPEHHVDCVCSECTEMTERASKALDSLFGSDDEATIHDILDSFRSTATELHECIEENKSLRAEQAADRAAVRALVDSMTKCDAEHTCTKPATAEVWDVGASCHFYLCDDHRREHSTDLPHAVPLRAFQARMATWEEEPTKATHDAPAGCVCTWLFRPTFVGAPLVERGRGAMPCPIHPDNTTTAAERSADGAAPEDIAAHELDVARVRKVLETGDDPEDIEDAVDWPAFWERRARLGGAAEAIESPVLATIARRWFPGAGEEV